MFDTAEPGVETIATRVISLLAPGAIVLLHDGDGSGRSASRQQTVDALPRDARRRRSKGYRLDRRVRLPVTGRLHPRNPREKPVTSTPFGNAFRRTSVTRARACIRSLRTTLEIEVTDDGRGGRPP